MGISPLDGLSGVRPIGGQGSGRRGGQRDGAARPARMPHDESVTDEVTLSDAARALAAAMDEETVSEPSRGPTSTTQYP